MHEPCVRRRCKFDFNTTFLSAPTTFARHRAKFILSNVALALGVKPALHRNIIAWFLWNTRAKSDCDLLRPSTDVFQDANTLFVTFLESLGCLSSRRIDPRSSLFNLLSQSCALNRTINLPPTVVTTPRGVPNSGAAFDTPRTVSAATSVLPPPPLPPLSPPGLPLDVDLPIHAWAFERGMSEGLHMTESSVSRRGDAQQSGGGDGAAASARAGTFYSPPSRSAP